MTLPFPPEHVAQRLLSWYAQQGRDLPWRHTRDPYSIWLSEIMLQQTTVAAAIPYYQRFLERFPTIADLAAAPLDSVIQAWAGLGYYSRARNLHKAAHMVMTEFSGQLPQSLEGLMALPGIGRSTAGAIMALAHNRPAPILDGNVRRVLVRLFAWREDPRSRQADKHLWFWAEELTSREDPHNYTQAIMDLGATVCTPRDPKCKNCPLAELCQALAFGVVQQLPMKRTKAPLPVRREVALLVNTTNSFLVRQRPAEGFLGGLWEFPVGLQGDQAESSPTVETLLTNLGLQGRLSQVGSLLHVYSHFKLDLSVWFVAVEGKTDIEHNHFRWFSVEELSKLPLHGAHRKALELVLQDPDNSQAFQVKH
ncbi:MAG: A/G-specific adenine glycosylase [Deltaproteobacteria bacterium]|jgi:A/G-specific adenine glycosylase|nr:A/G-specific adenine glycosylase [Deltaproteobacteria bacterium]